MVLGIIAIYLLIITINYLALIKSTPYKVIILELVINKLFIIKNIKLNYYNLVLYSFNQLCVDFDVLKTINFFKG